MRMIAKTLLALGFVGSLAVGASSPTLAQGVYLYGPGVGVEFGFGRPAYRERYYRSYEGDRHYYSDRYSYSYGRPEYRSYRRGWNWD